MLALGAVLGSIGGWIAATAAHRALSVSPEVAEAAEMGGLEYGVSLDRAELVAVAVLIGCVLLGIAAAWAVTEFFTR